MNSQQVLSQCNQCPAARQPSSLAGVAQVGGGNLPFTTSIGGYWFGYCCCSDALNPDTCSHPLHHSSCYETAERLCACMDSE